MSKRKQTHENYGHAFIFSIFEYDLTIVVPRVPIFQDNSPLEMHILDIYCPLKFARTFGACISKTVEVSPSEPR